MKYIIKIYYKIKLKLILFELKKTKDLQNFIKWCIITRIRRINNFNNYGYNDNNDKIANEITNHILKIKKINQDEKINKTLNFSFKDEKVLQLMDLYFKIQNSINKYLKKEIIKIDEKPQKLIFENFENISTKKIKKVLKKIIKPDYEAVIDRTSYKINISLQEMLSYLTLTTTIIFCGAFLYNKILFGFYNIDISLFFNLSDYVSSSIEHIQTGIVGASITLIILLFNLIEIKDNFGYYKNTDVLNKRRTKDYIVIFTIVCYYISGCIYVHNFIYNNLLIPSLILTILFIQKISFKYFKKPLKVFPVLLFTSIFFVQLSTKAVSKYYIKEKENIKITFKDKELNEKTVNYNLILVTSEYVFFESNNKNIKVFKKDLVESFEKIKKE
jgi:hypothetical protein